MGDLNGGSSAFEGRAQIKWQLPHRKNATSTLRAQLHASHFCDVRKLRVKANKKYFIEYLYILTEFRAQSMSPLLWPHEV